MQNESKGPFNTAGGAADFDPDKLMVRPVTPDDWQALANGFQRFELWSDAIAAYEQLLKMVPDNDRALNDLAWLLDRWGNYYMTGVFDQESTEVAAIDRSTDQPRRLDDEVALLPAIRDFLLDVERRRGGELPPSPADH